MMRGDLVFVFDALIATWCVAVVTTQAISITTGSGGVIAFVPHVRTIQSLKDNNALFFFVYCFLQYLMMVSVKIK